MYIDMNTGVNGVHTVTVANGNYSPAELVAAVRRQIGLNLYLYGNIDISYNTVNGHCFLMNYTSKVISFTFYDAALIYAGKTAGGCRQSQHLKQKDADISILRQQVMFLETKMEQENERAHKALDFLKETGGLELQYPALTQ
jgi:hypothetical protein